MNRWRRFLEAYSPPGYHRSHETRALWIGLPLSVLFAAGVFFPALGYAVEMLYVERNGERVLIEGASLPPFAALTKYWHLGFAALCLIFLGFAALRLAYFRMGGRSDYLMRRLPENMPILRRAVPVPLLYIALTLIAAAVVYAAFYAIYLAARPV